MNSLTKGVPDDMMADSKSYLNPEIAKVQTELIAFRDEYLPVFLGLPLLEVMPDYIPDFVREQAVNTAHRLSSWRKAIGRLGEAIPLTIDGEIIPLKIEHFKDFMFQEATPGFSCLAKGIHWRIGLFASVDWIRGWCWPPFLEQKGNAEDEEEDLLARLPRIKEWLLGLTVDDPVLLNGLCMILPFMVDVDPAFVKLALDPETWHSICAANTEVSEEQRQKWLQDIDRGHFKHATNNALLHVFGALGNNHFMLIRDYLDHPCLHGGYTGLMPHYLFALLFQKVSILRQLIASGVQLEQMP